MGINYPKKVEMDRVAIILCHFCRCFDFSKNMETVKTHTGEKTICPQCARSVKYESNRKYLRV